MTDANSLKSYLSVAIEAAEAAGEVIKAAFNGPKTIEHKGAMDLVTETDQQCEELIMTKIRSAFPDHMFIGEEEASKGGTPELTDAPTWMIDPLDGTTNFVHKFPFSCVSIGLVIDKEPVVGVVLNPMLKETFTAMKGGGAYLNGERIHCSDTSSIGSCLLSTEVGVQRDEATVAAVMGRVQALMAKCRGLRCTGSCAMNMVGVALGRNDAFFEIGFGGPWDCAGAAIIVTEAGGKVLDPAGGAFNVMSRRVLATNEHMAEPVSAILATVPDGPLEPTAKAP